MKKPVISTATLALIALTLTVLLPATPQVTAATTAETGAFSIIWITDTQYLAESNPAYNDNLNRWIVENNSTYNVKMVIHTGDLVNDEGNQTQWLNANQSMGILLDNGVPYCWNAGNHDFNKSYWIGNQYTSFNPQAMVTKPYWLSTEYDGMNNAVLFNVSDWECLIVSVADYANDSALAWANSILDAHPNAHAIVTTHAYIDPQCRYSEWATRFKNTVLDTHANVFLTLSGHYHTESGNRTSVGGRDELLFDPQNAYGKLGSASARILTFNTAKGTINVQTYSLYTHQFVVDENNNFTLNTSFGNDSAGRSGFPTLIFGVVAAAVLVVVAVGVYFVNRRVKRRMD